MSLNTKYINKYADAAAYAADASARTTLGKSTVSLEADSGVLHYDGVNVEVKIPKKGDVVFAPAASVYSAATPGSGVVEGTPTFIAGETLKCDSSNGYCPAGRTDLRPVGVVSSVHGRKATVLYGASPNANPFFKTATSSAHTLDQGIFTSDEWSVITIGDSIRDKAKRTGYRQCLSFDVLFAYLTKTGGENGTSGWSGGGNSDGVSNVFFSPYDWGLAGYSQPDSSVDHSTYATQIAEAKSTYGSDLEGYKKYLRSRMIEYPSSYAGSKKGFENAKAATDLCVGYNDSEGVETDFFPHAQWGRNHNETYGSFGNFFNVPGLRREEWSEPSLLQCAEIFEDVKYALKDYGVNTDVINNGLNAIGRSANTVPLVTKSYWTPFVRSRSDGWYLNGYGNFYGYGGLHNATRALSVALLDI
jgi:hypothetical protein